MADAGTIGTSHSGPGRRTDSTVGGWWTIPIPITVTPVLRQLPAQWWQAGAGAVSPLQSRRCPGTARLSGTVTVTGSPASRWVMICERRTLEVIAVTQSAADGTWHIDGLDGANELYMAVAFDAAFNVSGLDRLTAVAP